MSDDLDNADLAYVREDMADPNNRWLIVDSCLRCGRPCAFRALSTPRFGPSPLLEAFLDGLGVLAETTGLDVFGLWYIRPSDGPGGDMEAFAPAQVWGAKDRSLVGTMLLGGGGSYLSWHTCPRAN